MNLTEQEKALRLMAKRRGLKVRPDKRLRHTPFLAMHPRAAKELGMPCPRKTITFDPRIVNTRKKRVMDVRHEIIENDEMGKGKKYRTAHKVANRKQRTISREERKILEG
jgi:hypothetical protein